MLTEAYWFEGESKEACTSYDTTQYSDNINSPVCPFLYTHAFYSYRASNLLYMK